MNNTAYILYGDSDGDIILHAIFSSKDALDDYATKFNITLNDGHWEYLKLQVDPIDKRGL